MKKMLAQWQVVGLIISVVGSLFLSGVVYGGFRQDFIDFKLQMKETVVSLKDNDKSLADILKDTNKQLLKLNINMAENNGYQKAKVEGGN